MKDEVVKLLNGRGLLKKEILTLELDINYICKDTIKTRKTIYGNNFPEIAELESKYLGIKITPQQVAYKLAILKQVRIDFIKTELEDLQNVMFLNGYSYMMHFEIKQLRHALEDSLKDYSNYLWISQNYAEYEAL